MKGSGMVVYPKEWTCERVERQFQSYLLGTLVLRESLAVAEHLEACPRCVQRLVIYRSTVVESNRDGR